MKIQKINVVSESLKAFVRTLKEADATAEAMMLLGNLDPEFKQDADYLRDLLSVIETDTVKELPIIPPEPEPIIIPVEEPEVDINARYHVNAEDLMQQYPEAVTFIKKNGSAKTSKYSDVFRKFLTKYPKSKCGRNKFYKLIRAIFPPIEEEDFDDEEVWKQYPLDQRVMLSSHGHVRVYNDNMWQKYEPVIHGSYPVIYIGKPGNIKTISLGRAICETFIPKPNAPKMSIVPLYKDGNQLHCSVSNLEWGFNSTTVFPKQIHEACEVIRDNPGLSVPKLTRLMNDLQKGVGTYCLRSILAGKHRDISDKYFTIKEGRVIPLETSTKNTTLPKPVPKPVLNKADKNNTEKIIDMIENNKGNIINLFIMTGDLELAIKLFETKKELNMYLTELDKMIPVLEFINEGVEDTPEILKKIHEKYGYIFLTSKRVEEIKNKRFHREISELVF